MEKEENKNGKKVIRIKRGGTPVSPFIVRLSHPGQALENARDLIADLAASFVIDGDDEAGEADLVETRSADGECIIAFDEFREQLLEDRPVSAPESTLALTLASPRMGGEFAKFKALEKFDLPDEPIFSIVQIAPVEIDVVELFADDGPTALAKKIVDLFSWKRGLASFVLVAFVLAAPLNAVQVFAHARGTADTVQNQGKSALEAFFRGAGSLSDKNFDSAQKDFSRAAEDFADAQSSLNDMHTAVTAVLTVIPQTDKTMSSVRGLMNAGEELSQTAEILALAADDVGSLKSATLVEKIGLLSTYVEKAEPHVESAEASMKRVDPSVVPAEYFTRVKELQDNLPKLHSAMGEFVEFTDALTTVLGGHGQVRYLAAFQNNTELRPTGGFVGSFAELDVKDGAIEKMNVPTGGSYSGEGQLTQYVAAPGPLQLLKARWEFQDANWFPDFPSSAKKMLWFHGYAGGPTMDGVIAVNATFVQKLLGVLGPVEMPAYGRTITADNFLLETQKIVELEYDKTENAPKAFIGDLAPVLLDRLTRADYPTLLKVLDILGKGMEQKDIQVYFQDNALEASMESLGWSGSVKSTSGDYLMVVDTNLGGGKTDGVIDQDVNVDVSIDEAGAVIDTVTIKKTHRGMKNELFRGLNNVDYLRVYVPEGAELLTASGFTPPSDSLYKTANVPLGIDEDLAVSMKNIRKDASGTDIWEEDGKTVFGNWMQTAPGTEETVTFTYKLPLKVELNTEHSFLSSASPISYSLFLQKQSGVEKRITNVRVNLPHEVPVLWTSADAQANVTGYATNDHDAFFGWLFAR
ncbi:MAG: DUF4012 domain-containing protein [Patescibacteria group bacterium]